MKANLMILLGILTTTLLQAQVGGAPPPTPVPLPAIDGGGAVPGFGVPGIGAPPIGPGGLPLGVPGAGGGGLPGGAGLGMPPGMGMGGGMMGGMGMGGGMGFPVSDRYQLMSLQYTPAGKNEPRPIIIKFDKQTGQAWTLQPMAGAGGFRFMPIQQLGMGMPGVGHAPILPGPPGVNPQGVPALPGRVNPGVPAVPRPTPRR